jgi:pilus assembly protein Flp/PilA
MSGSLTVRRMRDFLHNDSGATAIEYALIASGIAGAIIIVVFSLGTSVQNMYTSVSSALN